MREIRASFPRHLATWLDEDQLPFGYVLTTTIENANQSEVDYVLLFLDTHAARSDWVLTETARALQAEKRLERTITLPVLLEIGAADLLAAGGMQTRKFLTLPDYRAASVRGLADEIAGALAVRVAHRVVSLWRMHDPMHVRGLPVRRRGSGGVNVGSRAPGASPKS